MWSSHLSARQICSPTGRSLVRWSQHQTQQILYMLSDIKRWEDVVSLHIKCFWTRVKASLYSELNVQPGSLENPAPACTSKFKSLYLAKIIGSPHPQQKEGAYKTGSSFSLLSTWGRASRTDAWAFQSKWFNSGRNASSPCSVGTSLPHEFIYLKKNWKKEAVYLVLQQKSRQSYCWWIICEISTLRLKVCSCYLLIFFFSSSSLHISEPLFISISSSEWRRSLNTNMENTNAVRLSQTNHSFYWPVNDLILCYYYFKKIKKVLFTPFCETDKRQTWASEHLLNPKCCILFPLISRNN